MGDQKSVRDDVLEWLWRVLGLRTWAPGVEPKECKENSIGNVYPSKVFFCTGIMFPDVVCLNIYYYILCMSFSLPYVSF